MEPGQQLRTISGLRETDRQTDIETESEDLFLILVGVCSGPNNSGVKAFLYNERGRDRRNSAAWNSQHKTHAMLI